jgi:uncharacterized membrane protein YdjX (TVP38/TMEM64 family)
MRARDRQGIEGRRHLVGDPRVPDALAGRAARGRRASQRSDALAAPPRTAHVRVAARRLIAGTRLARAVFAALIVAALVAFFAFDVERHFTFEALDAHRDAVVGFAHAHFAAAVAIAFGLYAAGVALCLPGGLVFAFACGVVFGRVAGTLIGVTGETAGASVTFVVARFLFADAVRRRFAAPAARIDDAIMRNGFWWLVFFRAAPILPYAIVNVAPALTPVRLPTFALATLVAAVPATFVYANLGATLGGIESFGEASTLRTIGALALVALLALLPIAVRRARGRRVSSPDGSRRRR